MLTAIYMVQYVINDGGNDLYIYRLGAETITDGPGGPGLYEVSLDNYPFTYPPFAALLFIPFALMPKEVGMALMMLITAGIAWWLGWVITRYVSRRGVRIPCTNTWEPPGAPQHWRC